MPGAQPPKGPKITGLPHPNGDLEGEWPGRDPFPFWVVSIRLMFSRLAPTKHSAIVPSYSLLLSMILVMSPNGHIKHPADRAVIAAGPSGAFFCVTYGPLDLAPAQTILKVYYTADLGRELFQVEAGIPDQSWWKRSLKKCQKKIW